MNEEYRRDRVVGFLTKYQVALIGLVVAVILGTASYRIYLHYQNQSAEAANTRYDAAMQLMRDGKTAEAQAAFDKIQSEGPSGYAMLARMKAVEALAARDPAAAARGYDAIFGDSGIDPSLRDMALIRGALIRSDGEDPGAFDARYAPLATDGFAFHASLRELLALAAFKRNDTDAAGRWLDQIVIDPNAPPALRRRAEAFLGLVAAGPVGAGTPEPPKPIIEAPPSATPSSAPSVVTPAAPDPTPAAAPAPSASSTPAGQAPPAAAALPASPDPAAPPAH